MLATDRFRESERDELREHEELGVLVGLSGLVWTTVCCCSEGRSICKPSSGTVEAGSSQSGAGMGNDEGCQRAVVI